jgi:hypothetical protein
MSLFQDLQLSAGSAITGWARFSSEDNPGFKDFASVTINDGSVWRYDLNALQNRWPAWTDGPWQQWEFVAPADGTYRLSLNIFGDDDRSSAAYFDNISVIPEPTALSLFVFGSALLVVACGRPGHARWHPAQTSSSASLRRHPGAKSTTHGASSLF